MFSEVPFWNSAEYRILYGIDFISHNSANLFAVQNREIPYRFVYTEFHIPSGENSSIKKNKRKVQKEWYMPRNYVKVRVYGIPYTFNCSLSWISKKIK